MGLPFGSLSVFRELQVIEEKKDAQLRLQVETPVSHEVMIQ
jgi:hypothetical protein